MRKGILITAAVLMLAVVATGARASVVRTSLDEQAAGTCDPAHPPCFSLVSTIAFSSTRDNPAGGLLAAEIYLMNSDGTDPRRVTDKHGRRRLRDLVAGREENRLRQQSQPN